MYKRVVLLLTLLSIIAVSILSIPPAYTNSNNNDEGKTRLLELTHKDIPDNLPWYPIAVFGDNRPRDTSNVRLPLVYYLMVQELEETKPFGVLGTGDHVGKGAREQMDELYDSLKDLDNVWLALGNHDLDMGKESLDYWQQIIAPQNYTVDDIPNWRIIIMNCEVRLSMQWEDQVEWAMHEAMTDRASILAFHRPVYPNVEHNLDKDRIRVFNNYLKQYMDKTNIKLVIQGHWHGYAILKKWNITWIITGGAGAPLYEYPEKPYEPNTTLVEGVNHYLYLILYPNQTFRIITVKLGSDSGTLKISEYNETAYIIENTKRNVFGNYTEIPVRVEKTIGDKEVYTVLIAPPNGKVVVNIEEENGEIKVNTNATTWYYYVEEIEKTTTTTTTTTTGGETTTTESTSTTTTTMTTTTSPTTTTITRSTSQTTTGGGGGAATTVAIAAVIVIVIAIGVYLMIRKK